MARKNPLGKIKDAALETLKDPVGTAGKAVGQARETVELGRLVAGQVTKSAAGTAAKGAEVVTSLVPGRKPPATSRPASPTAAPDLEPAVPAPGSRKLHGDPLEPAATAAVAKTPAKTAAKTPAKTAKPAPAKKSPATKTAAKKSVPEPVNVTRELGLDEAPVEKNPLPPAAAKKTPATSKRAAKKGTAKKGTAKPATAIDAAASKVEVEATPTDVAAKVAKKAPAKKAPAKKAAAKKAPAKKSAPGAKLPPRKAAAHAETTPPLSAAELAAGAGTEVITPVGTRGADVASNPATTETDLQQVGTEPLVDPATTKAVASESAQLRAAADPDKG